MRTLPYQEGQEIAIINRYFSEFREELRASANLPRKFPGLRIRNKIIFRLL